MLELYQYPPIWNLPSLSPFCIKVETWLRMVNLPYTKIIVNNPRKGPKGKMPVLVDDKHVVPDSGFILDYLQKKYQFNLDADLTPQLKALSHAVRKMIEENLYFVILYSRWIDPVGKDIVDREFRQFFPELLSGLALKWIRRSLKKQAYFQGIGRHYRDEIYYLGGQDIAAIGNLLGYENKFFLGDEPHSIDATIYAFLVTILQSGFDSPIKFEIMKHENLLTYCERMKNKYFMRIMPGSTHPR